MVFEKVKKEVVEILAVSPDAVALESDFINDLDADSLDIAQMLLAMENIFGVEFTETEINTIKTVGDVVKFIEANKKF
ncbi:MAG: acyl carrier protein [Christensenellaceae bacterium]|jgi:acyl carrier protein|nr:acyl carrier protein [Christensenellaceae bacterium]